MNGRSGAYPPSPPHSIARSSNGTGLYSMSGGDGRKYSSPMIEQQLTEHHRVLKNYLAASARNDESYQPHNRARDKLLRLSKIQFQELSTDVYDELLRREDERQAAEEQSPTQIPRFLLPKNNFHPKRNQARQKLSTLAVRKFRELATDVLFELERRYPQFTGASIDRVASPTGSTTSSIRGPGPSRPGSRPGTGISINTGQYGANGMRRPSITSPNAPYSPGLFENGSRNMPGSASSNEYGRPMPKTFQSNTMVPNKGTMVEDDDDTVDDDVDGFDTDRNTMRSSKRTTNKSLPYSVPDIPLTSEYQLQINDLERKVDELESQLRQKDEDIQRMRNEQKEKDQAAEAEKTRSSNLTTDLQRQLEAAESLNNSMQTELDKVKANNEQLQKDLLSTSGNDEWKARYENLEKEFHGQQKITDEVRHDAFQALSEMKALAERSAQAAEHEDELEQKVVQLEQSVSEWRARYARTKTQLRSMRASSMGLTIEQPNAGQHAKEGKYADAAGLIKDVSVTKFQIAIDELMHISRHEDPSAVLAHMRTIVSCVRAVTEDIDAASSSSPEDVAKKRAKLKSRVSNAANNLITAAKNFSSSNGLSPVSLVDAAASHLTATVVDLIKTVKIRPTPAAELEDDDDGNLPPETSGKVSFRLRTLSHSVGRIRVNDKVSPPTGDEVTPISQSPQSAAKHVAPWRSQHRLSSSTSSRSPDEPAIKSLLKSSPSIRRKLATTQEEDSSLSDYLAEQTDNLVKAMQPLMQKWRGEQVVKADGSQDETPLHGHVSSIAMTISFVIEKISAAVADAEEDAETHAKPAANGQTDGDSPHMARAGALEKHALPLLAVLQVCRTEILQAQRSAKEDNLSSADERALVKDEVMPVSRRIVRAMKALVERTERIEKGNLKASDPAIHGADEF